MKNGRHIDIISKPLKSTPVIDEIPQESKAIDDNKLEIIGNVTNQNIGNTVTRSWRTSQLSIW